MYKNVYAYLDEIQSRKSAITRSASKIKEITEKCNKEIEPYQENIRRHNVEISAIKDITIEAELGEIIRHIAEEWKTPIDELEISYNTNWDFSTGSILYAHENAKRFNREKNTSTTLIPFRFVIDKPRKKGEIASQFQTFSSTLPLNAIQKDGKTLGEHIMANASANSANGVDVQILIDDIQQLILSFTLRDLIYDDNAGVIPKNQTARAILNAAEVYRQKQEEMTQ